MKLRMSLAFLSLCITFQAYCATRVIPSVSYPATNAGLQDAIDDSSNGDIIQILAGTSIDIDTTTVTIDKEITIEGENKNSSTITTSVIDTLISITASNVTLRNLTIENTKNGSSQTCIACSTLEATGLVFDNLIIRTTEYGITFNANAYSITNSSFKYIGNDSTDRFRFIYSLGNRGDSIVSNNTFSGILPNVRTRVIELSDNSFPASRNFEGSLTVSHNRVSNGGLDVFLLQDSFGGTDGAFSLTASNNEVKNISAERQGSFISFYSAVDNPVNLYSSITANNNIYTSQKGIALIGFEGFGGPYDPATNLSAKLFMCNNVVTYKTMKISNVGINKDATNGAALVSYESGVYNPFVVSLAPCNIGITEIEERFATQGVLFNLITWTHPMPVLTYYLYLKNSDGTNKLLTRTADSCFKHPVCDNNTYNYVIHAENQAGVRSKALSLSLAATARFSRCCVKRDLKTGNVRYIS